MNIGFLLSVFQGGGKKRAGKGRDVVFEYPLYIRPEQRFPDGFFPGRRSNNALEDLGDEIYCLSGVRDDMKRGELVKINHGPYSCFSVPYFSVQVSQRKTSREALAWNCCLSRDTVSVRPKYMYLTKILLIGLRNYPTIRYIS